MACELIQREFKNSKGETVLVGTRQLAASKSLELHVELIGKVGTSVFPFIENKYTFGDIIYFMRQAETGVITDIIKKIVSMATVDGKEIRPALWDMHFNNEMMLVCQIFAFVCEANYLDFFKQGLEINALRKLEAEEASELAEQKNSSPEMI